MSMNHGPLEDFTEALADVQAENARLHRLIAQTAASMEKAGFAANAKWLRLQAAEIAGVRAPVAHPALAHDLGGEG